MPTSLDQPRLASPDRQEVLAAARRFFDAGLWCVVETEARHDAPAVRDGWEAHLLIFRSGTADQVLGAVEETVAGLPGARVPIAGYDPTRLTPVPAPPPVACSPTAR